jgi:hypothetical protein
MTDHICQIHGAPCRGRDSQDGANLSTLTPVEEAELTARANAAAAEVADDLVNQRTRTA